MSTPNWETSAGLIGVYPALISMQLQLVATPISVTYSLISGELPAGLSFRIDGLISGTPSIVSQDTTSTFVVRATEPVSGDIRDRTFSIRVTGSAAPTFTTSGQITETYDSIWQEIPVEYNNPISSNPIYIRVIQGSLPPGLEINEYGLIRGYPEPPVVIRNLDTTTTIATSTVAVTNYITVLSTYNMYAGRIITFTGTSMGGIVSGQIYYVRHVINSTQIQISEVPNGDIFEVTTDIGLMDVELPASQVGEPTKRQYTFTLQLLSPFGNDTSVYSIVVKNHYLPISQGGPNPSNLPDTRVPTIYNTRPPTYAIENEVDYGYFILPPVDEVEVPGMTYLPTANAYIGQFINGDYMAFKLLGHDFDDNPLIYDFSSMPSWLTGDVTTGWVYGIPTEVTANNIQQFSFEVSVKKDISTLLTTSIPDAISTSAVQVVSTDGFLNVGSIEIGSEIIGYTGVTTTTFTGITRGLNGSTASSHLVGAAVIPYTYITSPTFNFSFQVANNINGIVTWITDSDLGSINNATNCYSYVQATSDLPLIYELVEGALPPNLTLNSNGQIEGIVAYQPTDTYEEHNTTNTFTFTIRAYNLSVPLVTSEKTFTLTVNQYYDLPTDNLYIKCTPSIADRNILRTLLTDEALIPPAYLYRPTDPSFGKASSVIYAHAYGINASTLAQYIEAVQKNHYWRNITLGELKTAVAKDENGNIIYEVVYSDVIDNLEKYNPNYGYDYRHSVSVSEEIYWPRFINLNLGPWYTSSTDIYSSYIFDNDAQIITELRLFDLLIQTGSAILTQQGTPTFYTSLTPGYARILYPNSLENMRKRVSQELGADYNYKLLPLWMSSQQSDGNTLGFTPAWVICYTKPGYAETIKNNIENNWDYTLNKIDFKIDRFTVNKQLTYNYDSQLDPKAWTRFPSASPTPDPIDSENFYVLFPQKTILPTKSQYDL